MQIAMDSGGYPPSRNTAIEKMIGSIDRSPNAAVSSFDAPNLLSDFGRYVISHPA
jgi:hypothetical protein